MYVLNPFNTVSLSNQKFIVEIDFSDIISSLYRAGPTHNVSDTKLI